MEQASKRVRMERTISRRVNDEVPDLIGLLRLAALTRLPHRWLFDAAKSGAIPSLRINKRLWFHYPAVVVALVLKASGDWYEFIEGQGDEARNAESAKESAA